MLMHISPPVARLVCWHGHLESKEYHNKEAVGSRDTVGKYRAISTVEIGIMPPLADRSIIFRRHLRHKMLFQ